LHETKTLDVDNLESINYYTTWRNYKSTANYKSSFSRKPSNVEKRKCKNICLLKKIYY